MALNLKRGPKDRIWVKVVVTHREDMGKTFTDEFEALIRTPSQMDDLIAEAEEMVKAAEGGEGASERVRGYLQSNVLDIRKLLDADNQEVTFSASMLDELAAIAPYRAALVRSVGETRRAPEVPARKN